MGASASSSTPLGRFATATEVVCPGGPAIVLPEWKLRGQVVPKTGDKADGGDSDRAGQGKVESVPEDVQESRLTKMRATITETVNFVESFERADDFRDYAKNKAQEAKMRMLSMAGFDGEFRDDDHSEGEGQEHVLTFSDEMTTDEVEDLQEQLAQLEPILEQENFTAAMQRIKRLEFQSPDYGPPTPLEWDRKQAPKMTQGMNLTPLSEVRAADREMWWSMGLTALREGQVGVVILAGGDGSRLPDDPSIDQRFRDAPSTAMINVGLLSKKSIFQLMCERASRLESIITRQWHVHVDWTIANELQVARRRGWVNATGVTVYPVVPTLPFYIMTNPHNRCAIEDFFAEHGWFGRGQENFTFFVQDCWPLVSKRGKILMRDKKTMLTRPAGSGSVFEALRLGGVVMDLKARNITCICITNCDNLLAKVADPTFIGHCLNMNTSFGLKSVERNGADEPLGLLANHRRNVVVQGESGERDTVTKHSPIVLEYYEIEKIRQRKTSDQRFVFYAGNLCQYWCTVDLALRARLEADHALPVRASHFSPIKKRLMEPPEGFLNAYRLESLVSDICARLNKVVALHVDRNAEYAPVKSPLEAAIAVATLGLLHQSWIQEGGGNFAKDVKVTVAHDSRCEISPLVTYEGEGLKQSWCQALATTKTTLTLPLLVGSGAETNNSEVPMPLPTGSSKKIMKLVLERSGTLEEVDTGPTPAREWFNYQQRGYHEAAPHVELLPDTPRWLRDQELHWQEILAQKLKNAERQRVHHSMEDAKEEFEQMQRLRTRTRPKRPEMDEGRKEDVVYGIARYRAQTDAQRAKDKMRADDDEENYED